MNRLTSYRILEFSGWLHRSSLSSCNKGKEPSSQEHQISMAIQSNRISLFYATFLFLFSCWSFVGNANPPSVITSIPPLYSLAANLMEGVGEPELLMEGNVSPHVYTLRPSDLRKIEKADVIFWIGPSYENSLRFLLKNSPKISVMLEKTTGLTRYPLRENSCNHSQTFHSHVGTFDPHIWLDPQNAIILVNKMTSVLQGKDPAHKEIYEKNASMLRKRLLTLKEELQNMLRDIPQTSYFVFHDGYQYFEKAFNLNGAGCLTVNPEIPLSAKRISLLKTQMTRQRVRCLFSEAQFNTHLVESLAKEMELKVGHLDPLGSSAQGKDTYFQIMRTLATVIKECMSEERTPGDTP